MSTKTLSPEVQATLDSINASLGTEVKPKKPSATVKKLPEKWNEWQESNRIAYILFSRNIWKPVAMVSHCITQRCDCCGGEVSYIGNLFIRHQHKDSNTTWDYPMPMSEDYAALPRIYDTSCITVPECVKCFCSNTFQASRESALKLPCQCEIPMSHTCYWHEAQQMQSQGDLFIKEKLNGKDRTTTEDESASRPPYPSVTRDFNALKYASPRPPDSKADLWDEEHDN